MRHLGSLVGGALSAALVLAGASSSFAASAVQHPAPIVASEVEGSIIVAKKNKNKIGAIIGGAILGAAILGAAANANADERARDRDDDDYDDRRRSSRRDDDYNDRPRRRARRSGGGYARCADAFKSFRESDGTYQPYDRDYRVRCPYL